MERRRSSTGIGDYTFIRNTGQGQFGKVKLAVHRPTGQNVAIKIINKQKLTAEALKTVNREIRIMKMLWHPNIVRLYEVIETAGYMYLVMEYASGGEVMDYILAHGKIVERDACKFFAQTAFALQYCHAQKTVHRDIKAENLLLDEHMNIKLIDFGLSYVFNPSSTLKTFCGSPAYASPEVLQRHEYTGPEVDCWSLGVLLYMLVCGELPFTGSTFMELYRQVVHGEYAIPDFVSPLCRDLIARMLVVDPKERATIGQIVTHPWVVNSGLCQPAAIGPLAKGISPQRPLDTEILARMTALGYDKTAAINSIVTEKYDDLFATYYLLCAKRDAAARAASRSSSLIAFCLGPYHPDPPTPSASVACDGSIVTCATTIITTTNSNDANSNGQQQQQQQQQPLLGSLPLQALTSTSTSSRAPRSGNKAHHYYRERRDSSPMARGFVPKSVQPMYFSHQSQQNIDTPHSVSPLVPRSPKTESLCLASRGSGNISISLSGLKGANINASSSTTSTSVTTNSNADSPKCLVINPHATAIINDSAQHTPESVVSPGHPGDERCGADNENDNGDGGGGGESDNDVTYGCGTQQPSTEPERRSWCDDFSLTVNNEDLYSNELVSGASGSKIRSMRFPLNPNVTTAQDPEAIVEAVEKVLDARTPSIAYRHVTKYFLECDARDKDVSFEIEVCKLPHLSMNGIRFHKMTGSTTNYKFIYKYITENLRLFMKRKW